jgi:alpha-L-glutamate ligase-like protein
MATKPAHILGLNSRYLYTSLNPNSAKQYGFSKTVTKELLAQHNIATAQVYHVFDSQDDTDNILWDNIPLPFVIKPASGSAGKGVWLIKSKIADEQSWLNYEGEKVTQADLELHIENILDGEFTTWGRNHKAIVEELVPPHPKLAKYTYKGTPDIRVIVFNSVPIMAMLRLPTKESEGRANLDRGAYGLGIDIGTGITTYGLKGKSEHVTHFSDSKRKVNGIKIPQWTQVLELAVTAANAAGYVFMGADLFIHPEKGPMIVEVNGFPGLSIQLANKAGLKRRIERVEGLEVRDPKHGVKIGQALFAETFADKIRIEEGLTIIPIRPIIRVVGEDRRKTAIEALINTSRNRSAISQELAEELGLVDYDDLLWQQQESLEGKVPVVEVVFQIKNHTIKTAMVVSKRLNRTKHKVELGTKDTQGFLIGDEV